MEYSIKNVMEDFVMHKIDETLPKMDVCQCSVCKLDIAAMVLNEMPPKYVVTHKGEIFTRINFMKQQYDVDVLTQILRACKIITANPRHEK